MQEFYVTVDAEVRFGLEGCMPPAPAQWSNARILVIGQSIADLMSRFSRSHHLAKASLANVRTTRDTSNVMMMVRFWS